MCGKILLAVLLFLSITLSAADPVNLQIKRIMDRGRIVIALYKNDIPPFFYVDPSGKLRGIDIDLAEGIAEKLGVALEINREAASFDQVVEQVISGNADLGLSELSITLERAKRVYFTQPYFILHMAVLINHLKLTELKPGQELRDIINRPHVRIGILGNSSYEEFSREEFPDARIVCYREWDDAIAGAINGEIDAAFYDENVIERTIRENPSLSLKFRSLVLADKLDMIAIAVSLENPLLFEWVRHYLEMNRVNPELRHHFDLYFQVMEKVGLNRGKPLVAEIGKTKNPNRGYLYSISLLIILICAALYYRQWSPGYVRSMRWLLSPWLVLGSMFLGALFGFFFKESTTRMAFIGELYLTLLKMCALPIMITAVISSLGHLFRTSGAAKYLRRLLFLISIFLFLASFSGLVGGLIGKPGVLNEENRTILGGRLHKGEIEQSGKPDRDSEAALVKRFLPENVFAALSNGDVLGVLVFSILFGVSLAFVNERASDSIFNALETVFHAFLKIIDWSMYVLPAALFCLMAEQVSRTGLGIMVAMGRFILIYYLISACFILIIGMIIARSAKMPFYRPFVYLKESLLVAFGTFSSYAAMPFAINSLIGKFHYEKKTTNLVMPLGITVCRPGTILNLSLSTVFIAQLFGVSIMDNCNWLIILFGAIVAGLSAAGAPSAIEISALSIVLAPLGLPLSVAMILLLAVDPITDPIRTVLNVITNCSITSLTAERNGT
ncbi:MAG: cation:dicarboxylase symporter family transporter [Candidatus Wallbacteria bacterium]|nr:cation:dicarboxylase symporter family transporter [Candidatus Wallbacteria bacterium]